MSDPTRTYIQPPESILRSAKSLATISYTEGYRAALLAVLASLPAMHGLSGAEILTRLERELRAKVRGLA